MQNTTTIDVFTTTGIEPYPVKNSMKVKINCISGSIMGCTASEMVRHVVCQLGQQVQFPEQEIQFGPAVGNEDDGS